MVCISCGTRFWPTRCPACWRRYWATRVVVPESDPDPLPLEEPLEAVLLPLEQRGMLIVTIDRNGGRTVRLLPPRARAHSP